MIEQSSCGEAELMSCPSWLGQHFGSASFTLFAVFLWPHLPLSQGASIIVMRGMTQPDTLCADLCRHHFLQHSFKGTSCISMEFAWHAEQINTFR